MYKPVIIFLLLYVVALSCNQHAQKTTTVKFHIKYGYNKSFQVERTPFKDEKLFIIDSGTSRKDDDVLIFTIHSQEERLFCIYAEEVNMNIQFINDASVIDIYANYANVNAYSIQHSPASNTLRQFINSQDSIAASTRQTAHEIDSTKLLANNKPAADSLNNILQNKIALLFKQYKNFEDTVTSPAAFLAMYNNLDFGNNFKALKNFILMAGSRFPKHAVIQKLKNETLAYIKIFEEEYNVGDTLPFITLPDNNNVMFSTQSLKGKYYFIDFWSTWCNACFLYFPEKSKAFKTFPANKFQIISVAIDNQKQDWLSTINHPQLNWKQLIDTSMWQGIAVKTLKFDSIPFNFLISPDGIILRKAIKKDAIIAAISKFVTPG